MNVNSTIMNALLPLGYPVCQGHYTGVEDTYIVFNYADDRGMTFADDAPEDDVVSIQVHLFCLGKFDYRKLKKLIRVKLFNAGFSYPSIPLDTYESNTDKNHIVFECEIDGDSETEE
jgi:hypothetical protein